MRPRDRRTQTPYWRRKRREYILKWGMKAWLRYLDRERRHAFRRTPRGRYKLQREHAKRRGIEWQFTFESWWRVWERSGKWSERGKKKGQYVMARIRDTGPYSESNCVIVKSETNSYAQGIHSSHFQRSSSSPYASELASIL